MVDGSDVRVVTGRALTVEMWANNHGGDGGDSADDVREARTQDVLKAETGGAVNEAAPDPTHDEEVEAEILTRLGPPA